MKILGIVLAVLMLAGSVLVGVIGANKARDLSHKMSAITDSMSPQEKAMVDKAAEAEGVSLPSSGRLNGGSIVGYIGALAAVVLLGVTFAKKDLVMKLAGVAVVVPLASALIYPYVQTGPLDGMAPRPQALLAAGLALVGALGSVLAAKKRA